MPTAQRQVHGYRQGHQLLATSVQLLKGDQAVIDQLSDMAGPLRPREQFESYLTVYPLPSGEHFVVARTWQDLTVARAGCVRTLSLIIPMEDWAETKNISGYLNSLSVDRLPDEGDATQVILRPTQAEPLQPTSDLGVSELLEALFLEESRPVVVFDAIRPELIAVRLLTALWPSLRRRFALSTFALSPRKVAGRDFDLVFAPKNARAKFTDWNGRRVDGRSAQESRHKWTKVMMSRAFGQPYPRLLSDAEVELVGGDDSNIDSAAALRITMLWNELLDNLNTTPTTALGLLDIANSGKVRKSVALETIEPHLVKAVRLASMSLSENEAWGFLGALVRKLQGLSLSMGRARAAVGDEIEKLAAISPEGAVALLSQDDPRGITVDLLPKIASGIARNFTDRAERVLFEASPPVLARLISQQGPLVERIARASTLIDHLGQALRQLDSATLDTIYPSLLPLLTEDWQIAAAAPLLAHLDGPQLAMELRHLGEVNDFLAERLCLLVLKKALIATSRNEVRSALLPLSPTIRRNSLIALTLIPSIEDVRWLVKSNHLEQQTATSMLLSLLRRADDRQFAAILSDKVAGEHAIGLLMIQAPDLRLRALSGNALPIRRFVEILPAALNELSANTRVDLAKHALDLCLACRFGNNEIAFLTWILNTIGNKLDGGRVVQIGLASNIGSAIASRNMVAFNQAAEPARLQMVLSAADIARVLRNRFVFDLDGPAAEAYAAILIDAEQVAPRALLEAAGYLLPALLRLRDRPVSSIIAATFPPIYRELAKADDVPELLKFIPFLDWDRCKAARHELVDAFMSSSWPPIDLALVACRSNEVAKIMRRIAKQDEGQAYLERIVSDVGKLPEEYRSAVETTALQVSSNSTAKFGRG